MDSLGEDVARQITNSEHIHQMMTFEAFAGRAVSASFALYMDAIYTLNRNKEYKLPLISEYRYLHQSGVDAEFAAEHMRGDWDPQRIAALHAGSASSLTNGWL